MLIRQLGWKSERREYDWSKPNTSAAEFRGSNIRITGHVPLRGIDLFPHEHCEPFSLTFTPEGWLVDILGMTLIAEDKSSPETIVMGTKTQSAPIETHITIIKLLEYLKKKYIRNLEVQDEGGYWETGDIEELKRRRDSINRGMDMLEEGLFAMPSKNIEGKSPDEIADMIEKVLQKIFKFPPDGED